MALKRNTGIKPPRRDARRTLTKAAGGTALTYVNTNKVKDPLKTAAAKKIFEANERREAIRRGMHLKRRATARGRLKIRESGR